MKKSILKAVLWGIGLGLVLFIISSIFFRSGFAIQIGGYLIDYGPPNRNCAGHTSNDYAPTGYCIDVGMGQCLPLWTVRRDPKTYRIDTAYLYEMDELRKTELKNSDGSTISAYTGQYFYLPVEPKSGYQVEVNGVKRIIDYDITDMTPIIEAGITAFEKIPNIFGTRLSTWTSWGNKYPVKYNGKTVAGFKDKFGPFGYSEYAEDLKFTDASTRTALYHYVDEKGETHYCVPRFVLDRNYNNISFITFPSDTKGSGVSRIYNPASIEANPWKKNKNISKQPVNRDWVLSESGDQQTMSDLWNRALTTGSNGKQYLNPNSPALTEHEKNKVRAFYSTTRMIVMAWGIGVKSETMFNPNGEDYTKTFSGTDDFGIQRLLDSDKGFSSSDVQPYYPGPLEAEKYSSYSEEYINEYFTACGKVFLKYFSINEYCGLGMKNYGKIVASRWDGSTHWYSSYNIGKAIQSKNLVVWGGEKQILDDSFYETNLWKPKESYKEEWEEGTDRDRQKALQAMNNTEFLDRFEMVSNRSSLKLDEDGYYEDGERLLYDYPYVIQSGLSMEQTDEQTNDTLAQTYHYNFKMDYHSLICDSVFYPLNVESKYNGASSLGGFGRAPSLFSLYLDFRYVGDKGLPFDEPINNKMADTMGFYTMTKDREIRNYAETWDVLKGGRLWSVSHMPWTGFWESGFCAEYGEAKGGDYDGPILNFGSSRPQKGLQPESDPEHKVCTVNIYRAVLRTPTAKEAQQTSAAAKTLAEGSSRDICFAVWSSIAEDGCGYYTKDYGENRSYRDILLKASSKSSGLKWNSLLEVNENSSLFDDNALVVYLMDYIAEEPERNMRIVNVSLKDMDGQTVAKFTQEEGEPIPTTAEIRLDPTQSYYVDYEVIYEIKNKVNKKTETKSINTNLETVCGNDDLLETEFSTNLPLNWERDNIGLYNDKDAKTCFKAGAKNNRLLDVSAIWEEAQVNNLHEISGTWTVKIPEKYAETDNTYHEDWESFTIIWRANETDIEQGDFDNKITDIFLIDRSGVRIDTSEDCFHPASLTDIDLGDGSIDSKYTLMVKVERAENTEYHKDNAISSELGFVGDMFGSKYTKTNPLILKPALSTFEVERYYGAVSNNGNSLEKNGDYIYYYLNGLEPLTSTDICGDFTFKHKNNKGEFTTQDLHPENNTKRGAATWGPLDYVVNNFRITPSTIYIPKGRSYVPQSNEELLINFVCNVSANYTAPDGSKPIINNDALATNFTIMLERKNTSVEGSAWPENEYLGQEVFRIDNLRLTVNGPTQTLSGSLLVGHREDGKTGMITRNGNQIIFFKDSSYRLAARINGGNAIGPNTIEHESEKDHVVKMETNHTNNKDLTYLDIDTPPEELTPLCETPRVRNDWNITFYYTECPIAQQYTYSCGKDGSSTCHGCRGVGCRSWTTPANYYETYSQTLYVKTSEGEKEVSGVSDIEIRAGETFQIKAKTNYYTNRANMPAPNPYGGCAYLRRSPGYYKPSAYRFVRVIIENKEGNQQWVYSTFKTGWEQWHESAVFHVPADAKALKIEVRVETAPFRGYPEGDNLPLCTNSSATIQVNSPLPISQGTQLIV